PIRFVGLAPDKIKFLPLEARREMTAKEILEDHPKGKEYAGLVKGLKHYACFLDGKDKIMSMTPIINSELTGKVSNGTKDVFVECSGFDYDIVSTCLNMIVTSLADMGGTIEACTLKYEHGTLGTITSPDLTPKEWKIDIAYINKVLGLNLSEKEMSKLLKKMGFAYDEKKHVVLVPAYRNDILHMVDFAEDIAIAYGYENFTPTIPTVATVGEESWSTKIKRKVREILVGHGLLEMKNYNLISAELQEILGINEFVTLKSCVSK
ncbi:phenylalanine--tRNA ligase subunit beta, partial [Candidatus Woesearchaeota archaeon]|nr:phenylalanine--tRNA ligase subunit beta [Candidatus Woesearchaeota archaeon]